MAFAVNAAASYACQYEVRLVGIAQIKIDFDTAKRSSDLVDDSRNEFFDVERGGNAVRKFLQTHQFRELLLGRFRHRLAGEAEIHERSGGHNKTLLPVDCNCHIRLQIAGF